ncbi:hypothetical protein PLICRDRAFT_33700 [Plicaturopsis crispa FD-325 SS-3]|nr:hypothetical protein PLICRDRAFT_33700 [Plicaturopsis crispa FD-325 SS-3]
MAAEGVASAKPIVIPPLTVEEEDAIIHTRITNDERPLRRVIKKFHNYTALAHEPIVPSVTKPTSSAIDDAREAFLVELSSFHLTLKKSVMICEAEARQVEEYQRERQRIEDEHGKLRGQIEQLKTSLEHEQLVRRRKMEYDLVAERVNTIPSREELERSISSLENDMATIRAEQDSQDRTIQGQKAALDVIITDLGSLRLMGKDGAHAASNIASPALTPAPDIAIDAADGITDDVAGIAGPLNGASNEGDEDKASSDDVPLSASLNPAAKPFHPPLRSVPAAKRDAEEDDIEMGEVEEPPKVVIPKLKKRDKEELEEGEASDSSSALSDPPDDD